MSFTPNIPSVGESLGASRPEILNNFASLRSTLAANHTDVNASNPGTHTHADFITQNSDPNPPTGQISIYSKLISGVTQLFLQRENSGTVIQMSAGDVTGAQNGRTFLPGGVIMQWGLCSFSPGGVVNNFTSAFPTAVFGVIAGLTAPLTGSVALYATAISLSQFRLVSGSSSGSASGTNAAFYIAIGN